MVSEKAQQKKEKTKQKRGVKNSKINEIGRNITRNWLDKENYVDGSNYKSNSEEHSKKSWNPFFNVS